MFDQEAKKSPVSATPGVKPVSEKSGSESDIHVIPDQFYGAAVKTPLKKEGAQSVPIKEPSATGSKKGLFVTIVVIAIIAAVLGTGGYLVYLYRDALFGAPATVEPPATTEPQEEPEEEPEPIPPPSAPANLTATSTNPRSITLSWSDTSDNESAFRIERRPESQTIYQRVTDLPPNSMNFQDNSVQASSTYYYRVIARNESGESEPSNEAMVTSQALPPAPPKQEPLPPAGLDTDSDGLTDLEEGLFEGNPRNPDTEGDGFLDGNEVFNLYNPNGRAPAKLIESGMIKEISGLVGWQMMIPKDWNYLSEDSNGLMGTITSDHGESFTVSVEQNTDHLLVTDWYMQKNPEADRTAIMQYRSKGGYEGILGVDQLTTYLPWNGYVFVFTYHMNDQPFINYRTVYSMMLNSLVLSGLELEIVPAGTGQLPFEPAATSQGETTQPVPVENSASEQMEAVFGGGSATETAPEAETSTTTEVAPATTTAEAPTSTP